MNKLGWGGDAFIQEWTFGPLRFRGTALWLAPTVVGTGGLFGGLGLLVWAWRTKPETPSAAEADTLETVEGLVE
ncbi:hypothetical protein [Alienimonas sp. DA493]|uniref:hypothetical protein n=1 Tax=Alienimonas sp. DA493 TaxID=3373605 RepID=UPI0037554085